MNGQLRQQDFPDNTGGLNLVDSVFKIQPNQAAGGYNFDYVLTGGIRKRLGAALINPTPDAQLETLGFGSYAPMSNTSKYVFRAAGTKLQRLTTDSAIFTALTQDNAATSSNPFASGTTQNVQMLQFSSGTNDIMWCAGGGASNIVGAYSTSKYTANGAVAPTGTLTANAYPTVQGQWSVGNFGTFYYTLALHKASTGALSNAPLLSTLANGTAVDASATTSSATDIVILNWNLTNVDTTTYDQIWIYRSFVSTTATGISGFTTGSLIAQVPSTQTTFTDYGNGNVYFPGNPDILSVTTIPRAANTIEDHSTLPSGTYNTLAIWGHRLCTSSGNNLYVSDVNSSEYWPLTNYITVPSAGPITALATVSYTSPQASALLDLLVIFKEKEVWVLNPGTNNDYTTWSLLKIDGAVGCPAQALVVSAQGFLSWVDYRGVWLWNGTSKPIYCSRLLEPLFKPGGELDKSRLTQGCGAFFRRENQILWHLSSKTYGVNQFVVKMDVRLTMLQIEQGLTGNIIDGILLQDVYPFPVYACLSYLPFNAQDEQMLLGDGSGYCYLGSNSTTDGASANYIFRYLTPPLHMGDPNTLKQFHKVVVWVQDLGNWNLYLDYWSNYETDPTLQSTMALPISTELQNKSVWDEAVFDVSTWDSYTPKVIPLVFNLQSGSYNGAQGSSIQLQFRNDTASQPITIHGFSVIYSVLGGITQ